MEREFKLFLEDMLESMNLIDEYVHDLSFEQFKKNRMAVDAVVRNLEIIGEAANKIPSKIKEDNTELPWRQMYGLRNMVIHEYFGIDYEIIWEIVTKKLPANKQSLIQMINKIN